MFDLTSQSQLASASADMLRAYTLAAAHAANLSASRTMALWAAWSRLVTHGILSDNATILSRLLAPQEGMGDRQGAAFLPQVSLAAWQPMNLHGRYALSQLPEPRDIDALVREWSQVSRTHTPAG